MWAQMVSTPLPGRARDYITLWDAYQIVVPVLEWNGQAMIRTSIQAYNSPEDVDRLLDAISELSAQA